MGPERLRKVQEIYHAACEREPRGETDAFLKTACGDDAELQREVESLLAQRSNGSSPLDSPAMEVAAELLSDSTVTKLAVGTRLGPYQLEALLGSGGMGQVYLARDTRLGRKVAIKISHERFAERFEREARACAALNHPHICTLHDVGPNFLVMELVEGETLAARLKRGPLPLPQVLEYGAQIADALAAAHARGITHRDLKPGNVMIANSGIKVLDFGLAKSPQDETITATRAVMGTPAYMAPEQLEGAACDARTDLFSLGLVLYEMAKGKRPPRDHPASMDGLPVQFAHVVERCLARDPAGRWQSAADLKAELDWAGKSQPPAQKEHKRRWLTSRAVAVSLPIAAIAVLAAGVVLWERLRPVTRPANPLAGARFARVTDFEGTEGSPAVSPDGKLVAFISDHGGTFDVWLSQASSGNLQNLTMGKEGDVRGPLRNIGFAGDGSEIWIAGKQGRRLRLWPLVGGSPRNFLGEDAAEVAWSPDSKRLVYHAWKRGDALFLADGNGANVRPLLAAGPADEHRHFPVWSQDGRWVFFVRGRPATREMDLWRISAEGGEPERLTQLNSDIAYPTPIDVHTLLYTAHDKSGTGPWLWAFDIESKVSERLSIGFDQYQALSATIDGRRLAASVVHSQVSLWSVPLLDRPVTEREVQSFPLPNARALAPRFGGGALFYLSSRDGADGLWSYREGQGLEIWKGSEGALLSPPAISPDGHTVAIALRRNEKLVWNLLAADGSQLRALT